MSADERKHYPHVDVMLVHMKIDCEQEKRQFGESIALGVTNTQQIGKIARTAKNTHQFIASDANNNIEFPA